MPTVDVTRTYLELRGPDELRPARQPPIRASLQLRRPIGAQEYRALYMLVGDRWHWRDRAAWSDETLDSYLASPLVHVWVAHVDDAIAGYFELKEGANDEVEIVYFGLTPQFIGQGLGGWLLTRAAELSFTPERHRVVLNTCTLDGPHALPNYVARGFRICREETYLVEIPG